MTLLLSRRQAFAGSLLAVSPLASPASAQASREEVARIVDAAARPLMAEHDVPGMAVALTVRGARHVFNYGVAAREGGQRVGDRTLFEIGSISKTFTATLAGLAAARGTLAFSDAASRHWPALAGTAFDRTSLLDLGTFTAGGLPLQFPDEVTDAASMLAYFRSWRPAFPAGTQRQYSNPSIGLFGHLAARSLSRPFDDLMEAELFPALGLADTFIRVPQARMSDYAFGTSRDNRPIRVNPGMLASEAYGVKTTASDLLRFVEASMNLGALDGALRTAIGWTHGVYAEVPGRMEQGLGWELYSHPTTLERLLAGNSSEMALRPNRVLRREEMRRRINPLLNKTGSTNGFGAYVLFVPERRVGIVLLANRNYPIPARITAAHWILTVLDG